MREKHLSYHVLVGLQRNLEYISLLSLHQEEEHALGFVCGAAYKQHSPLRVIKVVSAAWYRTPDIGLVAKVFVCEVVFGADEDATGPLSPARYCKTTQQVWIHVYGVYCVSGLPSHNTASLISDAW